MPPNINIKQPCPSTSQQTSIAMLLCSLLSPCLVCMLGLYLLLSCLSLGWLSHFYILFMDDMIIINVDYIRRRMKGRAIPSDALFHSGHLGPEFRVLVSRLSVPNRGWDAMGSPCLTYLA